MRPSTRRFSSDWPLSSWRTRRYSLFHEVREAPNTSPPLIVRHVTQAEHLGSQAVALIAGSAEMGSVDAQSPEWSSGAFELNPFTMSHPAMIISCAAIGI